MPFLGRDLLIYTCSLILCDTIDRTNYTPFWFYFCKRPPLPYGYTHCLLHSVSFNIGEGHLFAIYFYCQQHLWGLNVLVSATLTKSSPINFDSSDLCQILTIILFCVNFFAYSLNKKSVIFVYLQNDGPGFCSVHRRSLLWQRGKVKHGTGS